MNIIPIAFDAQGNITESNLLAKVTKLKYAEDIRAGKLYMNPLSFFRKLEMDGSGDKQEGLLASGSSGFIKYKGEIVAEITNIRTYLDFPVFCTLSVQFVRNENNHYKFIFPQRLLKEFMCDAAEEYVLLIIERSEFQKRVEKALSNLHLQGYWGNVTYTDEKKIFPVDQMYRVAFRKQPAFSYQQECRLVIDNHVKDHFELNIGDIKDISWQYPIEDTRQEITIEIHYPTQNG